MAELDQDILAAVNEEVGGLSEEQLKAELLKYRVRQKVQSKKNAGSDAQKKSQQKQRAKITALKAMAEKLGIMKEIDAEAEKQAQAKIDEDTEVEPAE